MNNKIILYGSYGVGKSCILNRLIHNSYNRVIEPTIGASFTVWKRSEKQLYGIWDTAGQERFSNLLPIYLRDARAIIYCWDSTVQFDIETADKMIDNAKKHSPNGYFCLVFTKMDKCSDSNNIDLAKDWCLNNKIDIYFTSAFTGIGIMDLFTSVSDNIEKQNKEQGEPPIDIIRIEKDQKIVRKCAC